ncbi:MAG TPA: rhodanese-like domain-containing protein [Allosphingosinicella sp.]|nr:rhodanese-like domain-containing protein [Allosphingosinicella sp.]
MLDFALAALLAATPAPANPQIDYPGFRDLTVSVEEYRRTRLVDWKGFTAAAAQPEVLILDARSASAFARGHIEGAVNLPFTDFTDESLAAVIGKRDRPILIYCNNNFRNDAPPVQLKSVRLALNIQTFINLVGYGYPNVRELNEVIDFNDPKVRWAKGV